MIKKEQKILDAALKLFVEFGFHGTPTSKIAQEAGVANGTLFHYYKTKDDLILALYTNIKHRLGTFMYANTGKEKTFKETFMKIHENTLSWALANQPEFYFLQQFNTSPFLVMISPEEIKKQAQPHLELIQHGLKIKALHPLSPELIYNLINSHIFGTYQYLSNHTIKGAKQKKIIHDSGELLWKMIRH